MKNGSVVDIFSLNRLKFQLLVLVVVMLVAVMIPFLFEFVLSLKNVLKLLSVCGGGDCVKLR